MGYETAKSDADLLRAVAAGDERSFNELFRRYESPIMAFHRRRTADRESALDLVAETFAAIVVDARRFDPDKGSASAWIFGVASNKFKMSVRRGVVENRARRRLALAPIAWTDQDLERIDDLASSTTAAQLAAHLADLPAAHRDALIARVLQELPYAEVAARLRCSEPMARQRVSRGLRALRIRLENQE